MTASTPGEAAHRWLVAYTYAVDVADLDALGDLCAHVEVTTPNGVTVRGREVAELYRALVVPPSQDGRMLRKHHVTNLDVRLVDDDLATSRAYYLVTGEVDGAPALVGTGHYRGSLRRRDGLWSVATHEVVRDVSR